MVKENEKNVYQKRSEILKCSARLDLLSLKWLHFSKGSPVSEKEYKSTKIYNMENYNMQ